MSKSDRLLVLFSLNNLQKKKKIHLQGSVLQILLSVVAAHSKVTIFINKDHFLEQRPAVSGAEILTAVCISDQISRRSAGYAHCDCSEAWQIESRRINSELNQNGKVWKRF